MLNTVYRCRLRRLRKHISVGSIRARLATICAVPEVEIWRRLYFVRWVGPGVSVYEAFNAKDSAWLWISVVGIDFFLHHLLLALQWTDLSNFECQTVNNRLTWRTSFAQLVDVLTPERLTLVNNGLINWSLFPNPGPKGRRTKGP